MKRLDAATLIEHGSFLQRLAQSLLRDATRADDVVQEAWLAALRSGPRDAAALRPWLTGVVRNLVRRTRREEGRRARREAAAARADSERSTADVVAHEATRRALLDAVLGLEEPYRTVVLLRFYDDLAPREIAKRLGVAGSTVRTRLQRGLDMLRSRLDAAHGEDRRAWCLGLVPVALRPARAATVAGVSSSIGKGLLVMKPKVIAIVIPLCVLAVLLLWRFGNGAEAGRAPASGRPATAVADVERVEAPDVPAEAPEAEAPPVAPPLLRGVVRVPDGMAGEPVELTVAAGRQSVAATVTAGDPFVADVRELFTGPVPPKLVVRARHPETLPAGADLAVGIDPDTHRPVLPEVELTLRPAAVVAGHVAGAAARDGLGATIAAFALDGGTPREQAAGHVECAADGSYRLPLEDGGRYLVVAVADGLRPASQIVDVRPGATTDAPAFHLEAGVSVTGQVRLNGAPAAGATVTATLAGEGLTLKIPGLPYALRYAGTVEHGFVGVTCDDDGRYVAGGLAPAAFRVACAGLVDGHHGLTARPDEAGLERAATAPAQHVDIEIAAAGLDIAVVPAGETALEVTERTKWSEYTGYVHTDADGRRSFWVRPGGRYRIVARPEGQPAQQVQVVAPEAGERVETTLRLPAPTPTATLEVTVAPQAGVRPALPAGLSFRFDRDDERPLYKAASYEGGRYVIRGVPPGEYRLTALLAGTTARDGGYYRAEPVDVELEPGATLPVTLVAHAGGRLKVLLRGPDGRTDLAASCKLTRVDTGASVVASYAKYDGSQSTSVQHGIPELPGPAWVEEVLDAGRYRLRVEAAGFAPRTVEFDVAVGRTAEVTIDLE